jgi:hypothetical protein
MAAATADVTSIPAVLEPVLADRMLLMLYSVLAVVDDTSELTEDVVLIATTYIPGRRHGAHAHPWIRVIDPGTEELA